MWSSRRGVFAALALLLGACGFQPLYGEHGGGETVAAMGGIAISPIPDRIGSVIRNRLLDRMTPKGEPGEPRYVLDITLKARREGIGVQRDASVSRVNLWVTADFRLLDRQASRAPVLVGSTTSIAAFNVLRADYANVVAERDAEDRVAGEIGDDIVRRVGVFFRRRSGV